MSRLQPVVGYVLFAIALAWPLELLQYVPVLDLSIVAALTVLLLILMAADLASGQKLRVPFEVLWPTALIALLFTLDAYRGAPSRSLEIPGALALFIATAHFARSRAALRSWLRASVSSGAIVCAITLATTKAELMPTAYSLNVPTTFTFAYDLNAAIHIIAVCMLIAIFILTDPEQKPTVRTLATGGAFFFFTTLMAKGLQFGVSDPVSPLRPYTHYPVLTLAALLAALWLLIRVLAKVEVARREAPEAIHRLFWAIGGVSLLLIVLGPVQPRLYHGYLLGLACGYVLPERPRHFSLAWPKTAAAVLAVLVALNLNSVYPEHESDPRNYEIASRIDFVNGDYDTLLRRLDIIETFAPNERRSHLWRARVALELGEPNGAAMEFAASLPGPDEPRLLLPAPTEAEQADFIVQIRDWVSRLPEREVAGAYERTLLATGERDAALFSLQLLTGIALVHADEVPLDPIAQAVAFIIGDPSLLPDFGAWTVEELLTLLSHWGAEIGPAPERFPADQLPAIFAAQRSLEEIAVFVSLGDTNRTFKERLTGPPIQATERTSLASDFLWTPVEAVGEGILRIQLILQAGETHTPVADVKWIVDGFARVDWTLEEDAALPFTPAVRIYLP